MSSKLSNIIKGILVIIGFWIIISQCDNSNNKKFNEDTYCLYFKGVVNAKYIDKNDHNRPKIEIRSIEKTIIYDLANEDSGLFEYVNIGDSIEKNPNSKNVRVYGFSKDETFKLNFLVY